jgi:uncharacterized protein (TIRG00374 family)
MTVANPGRVGLHPALTNLAKVALSIGLMAFLVARVPLHEVSEMLRSANTLWLAGAWLLLVGSNVLGSWQWSRLLRAAEIRIPFWKVCAYYHVGLFFNNFLPANIGGDIARIMDASRYDTGKAAAFSTVLMDRLIGTVALAGLALVTTLPALDRFGLSMVYVFVLVFFAVAVAATWAVLHPRLLPMLERVLARLRLGAWIPRLEGLVGNLGRFRDRDRLFAGLIAVAVLVQVSRVLVHVVVARALGLSVPMLYFFLFVPLLAVIVSLPISFNGIGVREGAGIVLFGLVGVTRAEAFTLQFATYLVALAVSMLGGLVVLARIPRRRAEARSLRRSS